MSEMVDAEKRKLRVDYINQLNNQLFQRVNYFLVGIAFLITAFIALVTTKNFQYNSYFLFLALLVCTTGYILSIFFTVMNFVDSNRYKKFAKRIEDWRCLTYAQWTEKLWKDKELPENGLHIPNVWLIPLGFTMFW